MLFPVGHLRTDCSYVPVWRLKLVVVLGLHTMTLYLLEHIVILTSDGVQHML